MKTAKRLVALLAAMGLLATTAGLALAADYNSPSKIGATGANTLAWTGQGASNGVLNTELCGSKDTPDGKLNTAYLLWIFTTDAGSAENATLYLGGTGSGTYTADKTAGSTFHFFTPYVTPDSSLTAYVSFDTTDTGSGTWNLVISHGCPGDQQAADASISTEIHAGATDGATPSVVGSHVALGSTVHDSAAIVTTAATLDLPTDSHVTFYFFDGLACGDPVDATASGDFPVSGSTRAVDPGLVALALAAGDYSFDAVFTSGDTNLVVNAMSDCEPFTVDKAQLSISTAVHNAAHDNITNQHVALGTVAHDTATVTGDVTGFAIPAISFTLNGDTIDNATTPETGFTARSVDTAALAAGDYVFNATVAGNDNYIGDVSVDEPFTVDKGDTRTTTQVHNAAHQDITGTSIATGTVVHDSATVTGQVTGFPITGTMTYAFYANGTCTGDPLDSETVTVGTESFSRTITSPGDYGYLATYSGNGNYNGSTGVCEPFHAMAFGLTMGFWGNTNGVARIGDYAANSVTIGRGAVIDTKAESLKVLPNTLNACGKGLPIIFSDQTATKDCSLATGINKSSLNTLAAQTLALGYNIKLVTGYTGQTISGMGCSAYLTAGLTGSSTVNNAFTAAVGLINGSASGGATTQAQVGAANLLLGCLNREH